MLRGAEDGHLVLVLHWRSCASERMVWRDMSYAVHGARFPPPLESGAGPSVRRPTTGGSVVGSPGAGASQTAVCAGRAGSPTLTLSEDEHHDERMQGVRERRAMAVALIERVTRRREELLAEVWERRERYGAWGQTGRGSPWWRGARSPSP